MSWHVSEDVELFLSAAGHLLLADPARHTIALSVCANTRARPDGTRFAWWQEPSGEVTGAASVTPPYPVVASVVPDHAVQPLVEALGVEGVNGPSDLAAQVAAVASRTTGRASVLRHAERLYRLGTLTPPQVPGCPRPGTDDDLRLLTGWHDGFVAETGVVATDSEAHVRDRLSYAGYLVWEVEGRPVAMAGHTRVLFGMGRVGPVYTPPEHRGRGYGGAVTAAVSQQLRDRGAAEVVLFTDLTNPTTNALYPRLGYRAVHDIAIFELV